SAVRASSSCTPASKGTTAVFAIRSNDPLTPCSFSNPATNAARCSSAAVIASSSGLRRSTVSTARFGMTFVERPHHLDAAEDAQGPVEGTAGGDGVDVAAHEDAGQRGIGACTGAVDVAD